MKKPIETQLLVDGSSGLTAVLCVDREACLTYARLIQ